MQNDKAIIKALNEEVFPSLSSNFNDRAMQLIYKEVKRKKKQNFILMISGISAVSLGLIVLAIYLLKHYLSFNFSFQIQLPSFKLDTISQYYFDMYIAALILVLISLDHLFRNFWNKKKYEGSIGR
jgi:uncharacterized membrane protein YozB (DUF420 family)